MARIDGVTRGGLLTRMVYRTARRRYGQVPEPVTLWAHNPRVLLSMAGFEQAVARWRALDRTTATLVVLRTSQVIDCPWCLDFGAYLSRDSGLTDAQRAALAAWQDEQFPAAQRLALQFAAAASRTPMEVTDELVTTLREHYDEAALVELAMLTALENLRSRFNHGLGVASQGFCAVPQPH